MSKKKKNIILENVELLSAGAKGVSVGKTEDGKTILVTGAVPGDIVNIQVRKSKKNYIEGEVLEVLKPSPDRVKPRCIHFGVCGGCTWQHLSYEKQLEYKQNEVVNNLKHLGHLDNFEVLPIIGSEKQYFYRNKMEFSFTNARWLTKEEIKEGNEVEDRNGLGLHVKKQWSKILDLHECHLQPEPSNSIRLAVKKYADEHHLEFFNLRDRKGFLRNLMLRQNSKGEWLILIQFFEEQKENRIGLLDFLLANFHDIKTLQYAINPKGNDSVYDLDIQTYFGDGFLMEEMDGLQFKIGPKSFFQTNYEQALNLYRKTLEFAELKGDEVVYDLYTGTGTIAQYVARSAKTVIGIESVPEAIEAAKENAALNGLKNCSFYCGDMKEIFNDDFLNAHPKADVLITDPPRDGMHPKVVEQIQKLKPQRIVYVSCNSATQARDLAILNEDYTLVKILPVDMFPQTYHVENIALLLRK